VNTDPDCATTCGDGRCDGNAGELCGACPADCATVDPVCGNGACELDELDGGCVADCGPVPWPWTTEEDELVALVNDVRVAGYTCTTTPAMSAALVVDPALEPAAREWAWELAHHRFFEPAGGACNGRTAADREVAGGFTGYLTATGYPRARDVLTAWLADPNQCAILMSAVPTHAFAAIAHDADAGYVLVLW
jgi:hypothetical protein